MDLDILRRVHCNSDATHYLVSLRSPCSFWEAHGMVDGLQVLAGHLFVVSSLFLSILISSLLTLILPVSLSYFIIAVPMRKCLLKHSCMSCTFPTAILNGASSFPYAK